MAWGKINSEIDKIKHIIEGWQQSGDINAIEREVVLDKLRLIYDHVKFADSGKTRTQDDSAGKPVKLTVGEAVNEPQEPAAVQSEAQEDEMPDVAELEKAKEKLPEEQKLEEEPGFQIKPKRDRKALMSLYGDDSLALGDKAETKLAEVRGGQGHGYVEALHMPESPEPSPESSPEPSPESSPELSPEPLPEPAADAALGEETVGEDVLEAMGFVEEGEGQGVGEVKAASGNNGFNAKEALGNGSKKVFGETLQPGQTLSDVYARSTNHQDMAGKLKNGKVASIRTSIGINDKFLLIRDLFGGDADAYTQTMQELDSFSDLDDAVLYIHDNFRWNPDSEGAKLVMDLLTRKLA